MPRLSTLSEGVLGKIPTDKEAQRDHALKRSTHKGFPDGGSPKHRCRRRCTVYGLGICKRLSIRVQVLRFLKKASARQVAQPCVCACFPAPQADFLPLNRCNKLRQKGNHGSKGLGIWTHYLHDSVHRKFPVSSDEANDGRKLLKNWFLPGLA